MLFHKYVSLPTHSSWIQNPTLVTGSARHLRPGVLHKDGPQVVSHPPWYVVCMFDKNHLNIQLQIQSVT